MFSNYFIPEDAQKLIQRIHQLTANSPRKWGTMNSAQMLCHLADQLRLALGQKSSGLEGPWIFKTQLGIWVGLYLLPWIQGTLTAPTQMDKNINGSSSKGFETDKSDLLDLLNQVAQAPQGSLKPHPLMGGLNHRQWGRMIAKHVDYHLRQFGV